jgi:hypothetical protein
MAEKYRGEERDREREERDTSDETTEPYDKEEMLTAEFDVDPTPIVQSRIQ